MITQIIGEAIFWKKLPVEANHFTECKPILEYGSELRKFTTGFGGH